MAPRPLPFELIDHILGQDVLANADLAACCLVSQDFLPIARRWLYLVYAVTTVLVDEDSVSYRAWASKSEAHFQSLKAHPHLACLVRQFTLRKLPDEHADSEGLSELSEHAVTGTVLDFLQPLQAVHLDSGGSRYLELLAKHRASLHSIGRLALDREGFDFLAECPKLASLQVTSTRRFEPARDCEFSLHKLSATDTIQSLSSAAFHRLTASSHETLTTLRIAFNGSVSLDLSGFASLHSLCINCRATTRVVSEPSSHPQYLRDLASMISTAGRIQILTLSQDRMSSSNGKYNVLFSDSTIADALPSSLRRLDVKAFLSLRTLSYLTDPSCPARLRIIGTRPTRGQDFFELFSLMQFCAGKGVELVKYDSTQNFGESFKRWFDDYKRW
ncbi:hypothetical protein JCM10207_004534 [Rhodosporidiobolus poonsookiae]